MAISAQNGSVGGLVAVPSCWGTAGVAWSEAGLTRLDLDPHPGQLREAALPARWGQPLRALLAGDVVAAANPEAANLPVDLSGCTPFVQRVLQVLRTLQPRQLRTYGELAAAIECRSAQAVGQAVGANPLPWVIPCHRVVAAGPRIGGFTGGVVWKARLLSLEHPQWQGLPPRLAGELAAALGVALPRRGARLP